MYCCELLFAQIRIINVCIFYRQKSACKLIDYHWWTMPYHFKPVPVLSNNTSLKRPACRKCDPDELHHSELSIPPFSFSEESRTIPACSCIEAGIIAKQIRIFFSQMCIPLV
jgi:hypothetical protein